MILQSLPKKHERIFAVTKAKNAQSNFESKTKDRQKSWKSTISKDSLSPDTPLERHNGIS
jgi:hypothetical protein